MDEIITLENVNIKTLSRGQLEAAYQSLLRVSKMKTGLIAFLEKSKRNAPHRRGETRVGNVLVKCPSCDFLIHGERDTCPACQFDYGFDDYRCKWCKNLISVDSNICPYCLNPNVLRNSSDEESGNAKPRKDQI